MSLEEIKVIRNVSLGQFSVVRHYGGCTFQGKEFLYIPKEDALIRKDVVKTYNKAMKANKSFEEFIKELSA